MSDIRTAQWLVKVDGSEVARFPEKYLADIHATGIQHTERVKGFEVYVDVVSDSKYPGHAEGANG